MPQIFDIKVKNCGFIFVKISIKEKNVARKIVITSGKGGVGKTTVTANLGISLAALGKRVCLIDVDFGLNNLDVVMGLENKVVYDIIDVIEGKCRIKQALVADNFRKNMYVLPSNKSNSIDRINGQNIKLVIDGIGPVFDYILIDCPAGIDVGFHRAISVSDSAIVVCTPNLTSLRDADKVVSILKSYKLSSVGLVVNRARGDLMLDGQMMNPYEIEKLLKTRLIGVLPEEDSVFLSCGYNLPKSSESAKAYKIFAKNIEEGNKKVFDVTKRYLGILGSIRRSLKKSV